MTRRIIEQYHEGKRCQKTEDRRQKKKEDMFEAKRDNVEVTQNTKKCMYSCAINIEINIYRHYKRMK